MRTSFLNSFVKNPISSNFKTILSNKDMIKQTIGTQTIYKKKYPVRKKKMPFRSEPECTYSGNKRGRKSMLEIAEKQKPILKVEDKNIIMYFD